MIKLTKLVELKPLNEEEVFTATNKETGNVSVFKSKAARDAAVKGGSHEMRKDDKEDGVEKPSPKVNIFKKDKEEPTPERNIGTKHDLDDMSKPFTVKVYKPGSDTYTMRERDFENIEDAQKYAEESGGKLFKKAQEKGRFGKTVSYLKDVPSDEQPKEEPKKDGPVKDSSGGRAGNPQVNKATKKKAEELGITPSELGREEYEKTMIQAAVAALTDSNYHSEARELIAMMEDKPEWKEDPRKSAPSFDSPEYDEWRKNSVYSSEYYDADSATEELGQTASQEAGWNGEDALDGIAFELKTRGFVELAKKIQSVIKENKSTRLKDLV